MRIFFAFLFAVSLVFTGFATDIPAMENIPFFFVFRPDDSSGIVRQITESVFPSSFGSIRTKLEQTKIRFSVREVALAELSDGRSCILLHGGFTPAHLRYILKYGILGKSVAFEEIPRSGAKTAFRINTPSDLPKKFTGETSKTIAAFSSDGIMLLYPEGLPYPPVSLEIMKILPSDAVLFLRMAHIPAHCSGGTARNGVFALTISYKAGDPLPFRARMQLTPKDPAEVGLLCGTMKREIDGVYARAARLGPVPEDMKRAFTVSRTENSAEMRIVLSAENAEWYLKELLRNLATGSTEK